MLHLVRCPHLKSASTIPLGRIRQLHSHIQKRKQYVSYVNFMSKVKLMSPFNSPFTARNRRSMLMISKCIGTKQLSIAPPIFLMMQLRPPQKNKACFIGRLHGRKLLKLFAACQLRQGRRCQTSNWHSSFGLVSVLIILRCRAHWANLR